MTRLLSVGAFAVVLFSADPASAQIQTREQLHGYVNLGAMIQSSSSFYNANADSVATQDFTVFILPFYAELGLVDRWLMVTLDLPLFRRNELVNTNEGIGGATTGLGDMRVGLWSTLLQGPFQLLAAAQLGIPTGDPTPTAGDDGDLDTIAALLPTGDGEWDVELDLAIAKSLEFSSYPLRHYGKAQFGYWIRTDGFSDAFNYLAEIGTQIKVKYLDRLWLIARFNGSESFADLNDLEDNPPGSSFGLGNGVRYMNLGGEALVNLPLGLGAGFRFDVPLRGRLVLDAPTYKFYASFEF